MTKIDEKKLLFKLYKNARITNTELAREFNVSETAIRKKIKKLEENGVIQGYNAKIDFSKVGYPIHGLIGVDSEPEAYIKTISSLKKMDVVKSLHTSSGDHMMMIDARFESTAKLGEFVELIESMPGITKVCPAIILEEIK